MENGDAENWQESFSRRLQEHRSVAGWPELREKLTAPLLVFPRRSLNHSVWPHRPLSRNQLYWARNVFLQAEPAYPRFSMCGVKVLKF